MEMLYNLKAAYQLHRLEQKRERIRAAYAKDIVAAREKNKTWEDVESIESAERWEVEYVQDEIEHLHTQILIRQANKLRVPLPDAGWERSQQLGFRYLDAEAYAALRRLIREERRERWDSRLRWMPSLAALITAFGGVLGILIGLISILKK